MFCGVLLGTIGCQALNETKPSTTPDVTNATGKEMLEIAESTLVPVTNEQKLSLFYDLVKTYENNPGDPNYFKSLDNFERAHWKDWNAIGLVILAKGWANYSQAVLEKERRNTANAIRLMDQSVKEYRRGIDAIAISDHPDLDTLYTSYNRSYDYYVMCDARFFYNDYKLTTFNVSEEVTETSAVLKSLKDVINDKECAGYIRIRSAALAIKIGTSAKIVHEALPDVYRLHSNLDSEEGKVLLEGNLAWGEYSAGNFKQAALLIQQLDKKRIHKHAKQLYDVDLLFTGMQELKKLVDESIAWVTCQQYWKATQSSERSERILIDIINQYVNLHTLIDDGRRQTTAVEKTLSTGEKYVVEYKVSALLFKVESASERLKIKIQQSHIPEYSTFFEKMLQSIAFMQKAVDFQIQGYYIKKKDYRGEWEKSNAFLDESRNMYSQSLQSVIKTVSDKDYTSCLVTEWEGYIRRVAELEL